MLSHSVYRLEVSMQLDAYRQCGGTLWFAATVSSSQVAWLSEVPRLHPRFMRQSAVQLVAALSSFCALSCAVPFQQLGGAN
jgi:hypothetical protein